MCDMFDERTKFCRAFIERYAMQTYLLERHLAGATRQPAPLTTEKEAK
jgi:hypothetical protein